MKKNIWILLAFLFIGGAILALVDIYLGNDLSSVKDFDRVAHKFAYMVWGGALMHYLLKTLGR